MSSSASNNDPTFLDSMTFATVGEHIRMCDCDECDNNNAIPPSMMAAIRERKRQRREAMPIKRTQHRELLARRDRISVYSLTLPTGAEPLIEFGSSHRIVWIQRLSGNATTAIQSIGTGIIGSSDEEKSRRSLTEWKEGNVMLVPSNGGKAVGWIHHDKAMENSTTETARDDNDGSSAAGPAVFVMAKIPVDAVSSPETSEHPQWVDTLVRCCQEGLEGWRKKNAALHDTQQPSRPYFQFPSGTAKMIRRAFQDAIEGKNQPTTPQSTREIPTPLPNPATPTPSTAAACPVDIKTKDKCVPCEGLDQSALLSLDEANRQLADMTQPCVWSIDKLSSEDDNNVLILRRQFTAKNFQAALDAVNAMGAIAEREGHHPNFHLTNYREVRVDIYTHSLGGLTRNDFVLAEQLSAEVKVEYSPKWLRENPSAQKTSKHSVGKNRFEVPILLALALLECFIAIDAR